MSSKLFKEKVAAREKRKLTNPVREALQLGQAIWSDYIRRGLLTTGEFQKLITLGISGATSNPAIFEKAIIGSTDYDGDLLTLARAHKSTEEIYEALALEDIRNAADLLRPIYDRTAGAHGYASLEVSPLLAYNTDGTIKEARRLFAALDRPNVMIKIPATTEGMAAIRRLIGDGININITLIFSLASYQQVMMAYINGLEDLARSGRNVGTVASVASFFLSRLDTIIDALLEEHIRQGKKQLEALLGKAAISNAKLAYKAFKETFYGKQFSVLKAKGARVQRPLWASTGTKNPTYSDILYIEPLIGQDTVNTMPPATINAFLDHGRAKATLEKNLAEAEQTLASLEAAEINMDSITAKLLADGVTSFVESFKRLLAGIEEKKVRLLTKEHVSSGVGIGKYISDVEVALADLSRHNVVGRIWRKDFTVWKPDPFEIANRLGWLTVIDPMYDRVPSLKSFAREIRDAGFRTAVLLGMGGSSLGPEVLRKTFGSAPGYPELIVIDSTVPACVQVVTEAIEPAHSLFLISSKSGTTIEPLALMNYFRSLVESATGKEKAGQNFIAITDPGTPLARLAEENRFRQIFLNPPEIGGRYSVLSYFGLVPAAIIGIDLISLLDRADYMKEGCVSCVPVHDNPGAWLGTCLGVLAQQGRDKLTIVASPAIASFGLWVEQLIAESTGKEGKGIIPIVGEPLVETAQYANDRLFVYLRMEGDDNSATDAAIERIRSSGQPVLVLELRDRFDLGAEFFRWEFATAVAGAILGIHPFNQPNVQQAKDATERMLQKYTETGRLPQVETADSLADILARANKGNYLAIMAYLRQTLEIDDLLSDFRRKVVERYNIATTSGYGPRFLHSTGQLHKGGPTTGLFLQITADHETDFPVPGLPYSFGIVADAQALGDLQILQMAGRPVTRIHFSRGDKATIASLVTEI